MPSKRRTKRSKQPAKLRAQDLSNAVASPSIPVVKPQLANPADSVPQGDHWLHEIKFDGYRLMCYLVKGQVRLITRGGHDWTNKFREVADAINSLNVDNAVFDGELVAIDAHGQATFGALQKAFRRTSTRSLQLFLFDLPFCDGFDLRRAPLHERRALLKQVLDDTEDEGMLRFSDHVIGHGSELLESARTGGLEGTISKRVDSQYVSMRSSSWVKNKCKHRQEFVIGGYSESESGGGGFGALVVGYYQDRGLRYCGRVGTGFTQERLKSLHARMRKLETPRTAFGIPPKGADAKRVHWIRPELVAEVEFADWTTDGRLRHPVFLGFREDKAPAEVGRGGTQRSSPSKRLPKSGTLVIGTTRGVEISGVTITNPDRIVFPEVKVTKRILAEYYESVAERILPHIVNRPLTIVRCPKGLPAKCFYQRHINESLPPAIRSVNVREEDEVVRCIVIDDLHGLISLVQLSTLEFHPWGSMADDVDHPNRLIFDLDPGPGVSWKRVIEAAFTVRDILAAASLKSFVQTSGGKGLHVVIPITPRANWDEAKSFCKAVATLVSAREPKKYTAILSKSRRHGKVFVDYLRNGRGATSVATYSSRARPNATVATPLRWEELDSIKSSCAFDIINLPRRLKSLRTDPWNDYWSIQQQLPNSSPR